MMTDDTVPLSIVTAAVVVLIIAAVYVAFKAVRAISKRRSKHQLEEDIMTLVKAGEKRGEIKKATGKMIESVFQFDDKYANEIMTPRTDVFMIDINDPQGEYFDELMGAPELPSNAYAVDALLVGLIVMAITGFIVKKVMKPNRYLIRASGREVRQE